MFSSTHHHHHHPQLTAGPALSGVHAPQPMGALHAQRHNSAGCAPTRARALRRKREKKRKRGCRGVGVGGWSAGGSGGLSGVGWGFQVEAPPTTQALLPLAPPWTCGRRHILSQCFSTTAPRLTGAPPDNVRCAVENHPVSFKWSEKYE